MKKNSLMMRELQKRLRKLELIMPRQPDEYMCWACALEWFAVAYYLGDPSPDEAPFAAFARALGYAGERELNKSMTYRPHALVRSFLAAKNKLLAKFGVSGTSHQAIALWQALKRMEAGLPNSYKDRLKAVLSRADINVASIRFDSGIVPYLRIFA